MSICVRRHEELPPAETRRLEQELTAFYRNPPAAYYQIADANAGQYSPTQTPFHCDLVERITPGASVLEMGCGTAHLCPYVEAKGAHYTGLDHSPDLLAENRARHPRAHFLPIGSALAATFDVVASLYTIEHVVDPCAYLETVWAACKPGGLVAVICPEFVDTNSAPPSFYYGASPRRFREKLGRFGVWDAVEHLLDLKHRAPRWQAAAQAAEPGAFWINLRPRILHGAEYSIDADAVHLPRIKDLIWWFENRGAAIVTTSHTLPNVSAEVLRHNGYVLVRKPDLAGPCAS